MTQTSPEKHHRFKCIVDHMTDIVVWLSYEVDFISPVIDPCLSAYRFNHYTNIDVYNSYVKYQLYFDGYGSDLYVKTTQLSHQEITRVRCLRLKCIVLTYISTLIDSSYQRFNLGEDKFYTKDFDMNKMVPALIHTHNISQESAEKLMNFKRNEYESAFFYFESMRYDAAEKIKIAQTFDEVMDIYYTTTTRLMNINRINLLTIPAMVGIPKDNDVGRKGLTGS
jgi:hypothetical protein